MVLISSGNIRLLNEFLDSNIFTNEIIGDGIKIAIETNSYEQQLILTNYKYKDISKPIEDTINCKFNLNA